MRLALALLCLVGACARPVPTAADRKLIDATLSAWRAVGLPAPPNHCLDRLELVRDTDYAYFRESCRNPFGDKSDQRVLRGCTTSGFSRRPWVRGRIYEIRIAPGNTQEHRTIVHETCHVLLMCTKVDVTGDPYHTNVRVWKAAGGAATVEAYAVP